MSKTALLALNRREPSLELELEMVGYEVTTADSVDEMLEKMGIPKDSAPDTPPTNAFDLYCMNVNLDFINSETCEPAKQIYQHVKKDFEAGRCNYVGTAANDDTVENTQKAGIPNVVRRMKLFETLLGKD